MAIAQKHPIVITYHGIISSARNRPENREAGAELYDVTQENFEEQIEYLMGHGYLVTGFEEGNFSRVSPKPPVILTFDDGEHNNFQNAFPVLRRLHFLAHFFVTINRIGKKGYMGWEELKELRDADMVIGSHGLNHAILTNLKDRELERELADSKEILERNLKISIDYFSVPRGFFNKKILDVAKKAGYKKILVSNFRSSSNDNHYCVRRIAVKYNWSLLRFEQALLGQIPLSELLSASLKSVTKKILGASGYDRVRGSLLRIRK